MVWWSTAVSVSSCSYSVPLPLHHVCRCIPAEKDQLRGQILQQQQRTPLRESGTRHQEPRTELGEPGTELREPGAELRESGTEEREQGSEPRQWEPGAHRDASAGQPEVSGKSILTQRECLFELAADSDPQSACLVWLAESFEALEIGRSSTGLLFRDGGPYCHGA